MELGLELGLVVFNMVVDTAELASCGVEPSLPVRLTFLGVRKMHVPLRTASVTLAFGIPVWRDPNISCICGVSSGTRLVPAKNVNFFYTRSHLSAFQNFALLLSIYF